MKRTFLISVIATSFFAFMVALEATADSLAEAELVALDHAWIDAEVSGDRKALERILDEQFLATWASGKTIDRTAYLIALLNEKIAVFSE